MMCCEIRFGRVSVSFSISDPAESTADAGPYAKIADDHRGSEEVLGERLDST